METTQAPETNETAVEVIDGIEVQTIEANDEPKEDAMATAKTTKATKKTSKKTAGKTSAKSTTKAKANAAPAKKTTAKATPAKKASTRKAKAGDLTMGGLVELYSAELARMNKTEKTIASYAADLRIAVKYFGEDTPIAKLTAKQVGAYFDSPAVCANRQGGARNPITVGKVRRTFRMALEHLAKIGIISEAPIPDAK